MEVVQKNTSKGIVIRFVFEDVDEYNLCMDNLTEICEGMSEHGNEHLKRKFYCLVAVSPFPVTFITFRRPVITSKDVPP